jgi:hypothetical protein
MEFNDLELADILMALENYQSMMANFTITLSEFDDKVYHHYLSIIELIQKVKRHQLERKEKGYAQG